MFLVVLQLPQAQLENALNKTAALKQPLIAHASQPDIQPTLPRFINALFTTMLGFSFPFYVSLSFKGSAFIFAHSATRTQHFLRC